MFTHFLRCRKGGHTLLEAIIATAVFVMVVVAISGMWAMYGKALGKSSEYIAANHLAQGLTEGLIANGWDWLVENLKDRPSPMQEDFTVSRTIRGRVADIKFNALYDARFNYGNAVMPGAPENLCLLIVTVRWRSTTGEKTPDDGADYNNQTTYSTYLYQKGI